MPITNCPTCDGDGTVLNGAICRTCKGTGRLVINGPITEKRDIVKSKKNLLESEKKDVKI